jgi:hypothetical protein
MVHNGQCEVQQLEKENMSDGESSDGEVDFRPTLDIESLPKVLQNFLKGFNYICFSVQSRM